MTRSLRPSDARQCVWDILYNSKKPLSLDQICEAAKLDKPAVSRYLSALKKIEYAENSFLGWNLIKKTGQKALQVNSRGGFRDYNLNPLPSPEELIKCIKHSSLSINGFAIKYGIGPGTSTRIREMIEGHRTISKSVEEAIILYKNENP